MVWKYQKVPLKVSNSNPREATKLVALIESLNVLETVVLVLRIHLVKTVDRNLLSSCEEPDNIQIN